jgi:parallel beta-helix repeat protein
MHKVAGKLRRTASILIVASLFLSLSVFALNVRPAKAAVGTIVINPDGSINSPVPANITTSDNVTYTFTNNNYLTIIVNRSNTIINGMGYTLQAGSGNDGFFIEYPVHNVTIKNTIITNNGWGIVLDASNNDTLSGNIITGNANYGIEVVYMGGNTVSDNNVTANGNGIFLGLSNNHTVSGNIVKANTQWGIELQSSSGNVVSDNNITGNGYGVYFYDAVCSQNKFYHNNLVGNTYQVRSLGSANTWDDGYPSGGNYWSNYQTAYPSAAENDSSAIWNTPYFMNLNNTDRYPLMGQFYTFPVLPSPLNGIIYNVDIISNSSISNFNSAISLEVPEDKLITFNVTGTSGTVGFCRVDIPTDYAPVGPAGYWALIVGGTGYTNETIITSGNYTYIYFTYHHSTEIVQIGNYYIVPEFQPYMFLPLFMIVTLLGALVLKRRAAEPRR